MMFFESVQKNTESGFLIGGRLFNIHTIINPKYFDADTKSECRQEYSSACPFEHIVFEDLLNRDFLQAILDGWNEKASDNWRHIKTINDNVFRSKDFRDLSFASQIFFHAVNSYYFTAFLTDITGVKDIIVDTTTKSGGQHETKRGGILKPHLDFVYHERTMLTNAMVMITYLNHDWKDEYEGALELWQNGRCVKSILPVFGRTVIFKNGPKSFHGHPKPLNTPEGRTRRSIANYYYTNPEAEFGRQSRWSSTYIDDTKSIFTKNNVKRALRAWMPPILWNIAKKRLQTF